MSETKENAQAIIDFAKEKLASATILPVTATVGSETLTVPVLVRQTPLGATVESVKGRLLEYATRPERREGVAISRDIESFIAHVNRFKDPGSALFADPDPAKPVLIAVLDYHPIGAESPPRFGKHRTRYAFPLSQEWQKWSAVDGAELSQAQFAEFIEDQVAALMLLPDDKGEILRAYANQIETTFASPSALMQLSRGLSVNVASTVASSQNLSSGEGQIFFKTDHQDTNGKPLKVPGAFVISIPVFELGAQHLLAIRLRYRVNGGRVTWFMNIYRRIENFDVAVREAAAMAQAGTELPLFFGAPE